MMTNLRPKIFYSLFLPLLNLLDGLITYNAIKYYGQTEANPLYAGASPEIILTTKIILTICGTLLFYHAVTKIENAPLRPIWDKIAIAAYWGACGVYIIINIAQGAFIT